MKRRAQSIYLVSVVCLFFVCAASGQQFTRCWRSSIEGFDDHYVRAEAVLFDCNAAFVTPGPEAYTDATLRTLKLYVAAKRFPGVSEPQLYVHTNFKPEGKLNPLKLAIPLSTLDFVSDGRGYDLGAIVCQVLANEGVSSAPGKLAKNATVDIDPSAIEIFPKLRIGDVRTKNLATPDSALRPFAELTDATGQTKRLTQMAPPPADARLFVSDKLAAEPQKFAALSQCEFRRNDITLLSFVHDNATRDYLATSLGEARGPTIPEDISVEAFVSLLKQQGGKTVFVLGHIEGGQFYLSKDGTSKLALTEIERLSKDNDITIGVIGCASGLSDNGIIVSKYINSLVAAKQFVAARTAKNYLEFFERLSSPDLEVVVSDELVSRLADGSKFVTAHGDLYAHGVSVDGVIKSSEGSVAISGKVRGN